MDPRNMTPEQREDYHAIHDYLEEREEVLNQYHPARDDCGTGLCPPLAGVAKFVGYPPGSVHRFEDQRERPFDHKTAKWRKERPLVTGVLDYFPDALLEVAHCSYVGNEQHNPGEPLHWAKEKSADEADALLRHLSKRGSYDSDGVRHSAKVAWRALALLQRELEAERNVSTSTSHGR